VDTAQEFTAAIPEPYQILGLKLLPLSLGRYRLLHRFKCAFVADGSASATMGDLLMGLAICSLRCDEFLKSYETGEFFTFLKRWAKRINSNPPWYLRGKYGRILSCTFLGRRWRKTHSFNFIEKMKLFERYITDAQKMPTYIPTQSSNHRNTAHWSTSVEIILRSELGWTVEEINEAPLSKAVSDYFKHLEQQGLVTIFTEQDLEEGRQNAAALENTGSPPPPLSTINPQLSTVDGP
jgi:hypothetical protein